MVMGLINPNSFLLAYILSDLKVVTSDCLEHNTFNWEVSTFVMLRLTLQLTHCIPGSQEGADFKVEIFFSRASSSPLVYQD